MAPLRAIAEALDRAEKRIIVRARKAFKPLREQFIRDILDGRLEIYDVHKLAEAFRAGMLSAYIFSRAAIKGDIRKKLKESRKLAEEESYWAQLIKFILRADKLLVQRLIRRKIDPMNYYFRPSDAVLQFLDGYTLQLAHVIQEDLLRSMTQWVRDTIQQGMSEREAIKYLASKTKQFGERRLQKIARTEATRAYNIGTLEESHESDIVVGYKFDAVLDKRTTDICRARDGKFIPKSETELLLHNTPPLHVNCRSRLVPVTEFDELPPAIMPSEWRDSRYLPKQRDYDIANLRKILSTKLS